MEVEVESGGGGVEVAVEKKEGNGGRSGLNMPPGPPPHVEKNHMT